MLSRVRDADRPTRKPMALWDRVKFLLLLVALFWFFVWSDMADNPILPFEDALNRTFESKWWVLALIGLEAIRQAHFLLAESWPGYHHFWADGRVRSLRAPGGPLQRLEPVPLRPGGQDRRLPAPAERRARRPLRRLAGHRPVRAARPG